MKHEEFEILSEKPPMLDRSSHLKKISQLFKKSLQILKKLNISSKTQQKLDKTQWKIKKNSVKIEKTQFSEIYAKQNLGKVVKKQAW